MPSATIGTQSITDFVMALAGVDSSCVLFELIAPLPKLTFQPDESNGLEKA